MQTTNTFLLLVHSLPLCCSTTYVYEDTDNTSNSSSIENNKKK